MNLGMKSLLNANKSLTAEENIELIRKYRAGDKDAFEKLVLGNLRLVDSVINGISKYNRLKKDMFQEGIIGLMKAVENYDENKGCFSTYAYKWIRCYVLNFIRDNENVHYSAGFYTLLTRCRKNFPDVPFTITDEEARTLGFKPCSAEDVLKMDRDVLLYGTISDVLENSDAICNDVNNSTRYEILYKIPDLNQTIEKVAKKLLTEKEFFCLGTYYGVGFPETQNLRKIAKIYSEHYHHSMSHQAVSNNIKRAELKLQKSTELKNLFKSISDGSLYVEM